MPGRRENGQPGTRPGLPRDPLPRDRAHSSLATNRAALYPLSRGPFP
jgi:hypothetical protein